MTEIGIEIQEISENADKCVNFPIGDKLAEFFRHQETHNSTNFVLSGVLIYAAAKIFGRKVDYLEQEILGIAKNFEQISAEEEKIVKEVKKSRTKKFTIKDAINIDKVTFEEKEITVVTKSDINKTLATPSRITRLQKMKEFFAKNKSKTGKLPIPKSLLMNDSIVSNFGGTLIHDYDDYKDIVGSRKDFRSFSHFINHTTGELQSEVSFGAKPSRRDDFIVSEADPQEFTETIKEMDEITSLPTPPPSPAFDFDISGKITPSDSSINLDEGIGMDDDPSSLLLPVDHPKQFPEIIRDNYEPFPAPCEETIESTFDKSMKSIRESLADKIVDFELPKELRADVSETRMKNMFMIPLKRLKHKCLFDLPDEYKELKKRKMDQWKPLLPEVINPRIFKYIPPDGPIRSDKVPFYGFTKEEQNESPATFNYTSSKPSKNDTKLKNDSSVKNDSGFDSFNSINSSKEEMTLSTDEDTKNIDSSNDSDDHHDIDSSEELNLQETSGVNTSGSDSCYQSLDSGVSGKLSKSLGPSFAEEFNIGHSTEIDIQQEVTDERSSLESEERVKQMQQSAMNVAKWKEFLKPILAESEKRSKIDMHEYGLTVINKIGLVNESKRFDEIVEQGQTPAYFLTMLQLINNRNIEVKFSNKTITAPTELHDISLTLKSKVVHKEKFDVMGEQFNQAENKKLNKLKRTAVQTSTPAKRRSLLPSEMSLSFNTSAVDDANNSQHMCRLLSQASSGYYSQNSTFSDF